MPTDQSAADDLAAQLDAVDPTAFLGKWYKGDLDSITKNTRRKFAARVVAAQTGSSARFALMHNTDMELKAAKGVNRALIKSTLASAFMNVVGVFLSLLFAYLPSKSFEQQQKELTELRKQHMDVVYAGKIDSGPDFIVPKHSIAFDALPTCVPDFTVAKTMAVESLDHAVAECLTSDCIGFTHYPKKDAKFYLPLESDVNLTKEQLAAKLCPTKTLDPTAMTYISNTASLVDELRALKYLVPDYFAELLKRLNLSEADVDQLAAGAGKDAGALLSANGALLSAKEEAPAEVPTWKEIIRSLPPLTVFILVVQGRIPIQEVINSLGRDGLTWKSTNRIEWWMGFLCMVALLFVGVGAAEDDLSHVTRPFALCAGGSCMSPSAWHMWARSNNMRV